MLAGWSLQPIVKFASRKAVPDVITDRPSMCVDAQQFHDSVVVDVLVGYSAGHPRTGFPRCLQRAHTVMCLGLSRVFVAASWMI